ncbi:MAG: glycosyltransferase family 1 protein [Pseudomonadota bacterium]
MTSICIDCRYVGRQPSGIGEMVQGIIRHIPQLAPELSFLLLRNPQNNECLNQSPNVSEMEVAAAANSPATMWRLPELVDLKRIQLFHAPANILPARLSVPTLTTIHDIMWLTHPHWCKRGPLGHIERAFYGHGIRRAIAHSTRIAALSGATKEAILRHTPQAAERVCVIHSGVSPRFRPTLSDPARLEALGLRPGQPFVLTVGQHAPYKNHEGALRAFAHAFASQEDIALVFVQRQGRGAQELRNLARKLGVEGRVQILDAIAPDDLVQLYSSAKALLHPSLAEGFGNPIVEAMACGCPVVTSNQSAMPEVASGAAKLVDPQDKNSIAAALCEVVNDPNVRQGLREAGLSRARTLDWKSAAQKYVTLYREIVAEA